MDTLRTQDTDTEGLAGSFIPVVAYDTNKGEWHFAAAHYHEIDSEPLEETEQIEGYEAIGNHVRELLEKYAEQGNLIALIDAVAIIETYWEYFEVPSVEQINSIVAEICSVTDREHLLDLMDESKNAERLYQGVLAEVKDRLAKSKHLSDITKDPLLDAYVQSHVAEHGVSELEAVSTLLEALQKTPE